MRQDIMLLFAPPLWADLQRHDEPGRPHADAVAIRTVR
jgi:hypothetical protein